MLVNNTALGVGDQIDIRDNYLDVSTGSDDMQDIQELITRGVEVQYLPQSSP